MISEAIIVGKDTKYPLKGILTLPDEMQSSEEKVPAVVFVHGSGTSNMDEKVLKMTPFKDLAEGLAEHGIASVRYDKRSFAHGRKMVKEKEPITVKEETIEDAILATEILRQDERIDGERIFIVGHSMGAMLAPRIDAEGGNYRGLVLLAGSPRKMEEILIEQTAEILDGMNPVLKFFYGGVLKNIIKKMDGMYDVPDEEAKKKKLGNGTTLYYFKEMGNHAVETYLQELKKPILVMQGEKDFQVKAEKDFVIYQELLKNHPDAAFKLYEGLNHCFVPSIYGELKKAMKEYNVEQHIGKDVIGDIAQWILEK